MAISRRAKELNWRKHWKLTRAEQAELVNKLDIIRHRHTRASEYEKLVESIDRQLEWEWVQEEMEFTEYAERKFGVFNSHCKTYWEQQLRWWYCGIPISFREYLWEYGGRKKNGGHPTCSCKAMGIARDIRGDEE